jgi:hypothetical protein
MNSIKESVISSYSAATLSSSEIESWDSFLEHFSPEGSKMREYASSLSVGASALTPSSSIRKRSGKEESDVWMRSSRRSEKGRNENSNMRKRERRKELRIDEKFVDIRARDDDEKIEGENE